MTILRLALRPIDTYSPAARVKINAPLLYRDTNSRIPTSASPRDPWHHRAMVLDMDACYRAFASRDRRFDGKFVSAVVTTGIYCRPSCPARTPARHNVRFYPHPAAAEAEIMFRLVGDVKPLKKQIEQWAKGKAELEFGSHIPAQHFHTIEGFEVAPVAYTSDIPLLGRWGTPVLFGPGSIHVAHTLEERVPKQQLLEAVEIYQRMVKQLWKQESKSAS